MQQAVRLRRLGCSAHMLSPFATSPLATAAVAAGTLGPGTPPGAFEFAFAVFRGGSAEENPDEGTPLGSMGSVVDEGERLLLAKVIVAGFRRPTGRSRNRSGDRSRDRSRRPGCRRRRRW